MIKLKQVLCLLVILCLYFLKVSGQQVNASSGIKWTEGLSWDQVKQKAKQENKYIFMDCYATWCGPCKAMDKGTYTDEQLGALVNEKFIAVKVQMDSTKDDNEPVQKWYSTVNEIKTKYAIAGYPSYLFFSPNAELVHQDLGYKPAKDFISLVNDVLNPATQFAKVMERYQSGEREPTLIIKAIKAAKQFGQKKLADSLARNYKKEFLNSLDDAALFTKDNIQFVAQDFYFLIYEDGSKGRFFDFFYHHPQKVDNFFYKGFAGFYVNGIIRKEELFDKLIQNNKAVTNTPDWEAFRKEIALKYDNDYAQKIVSEFQPGFYQYIGNWQKWADLFEEKIRKNSPEKGGKHFGDFGDDWVLNDNAWTVFKSCNDKAVLLRALKWSELSLKLIKPANNDSYLDTKANLLYKIGKRRQAIKTEKKALQVDTENAQKEGKNKGYSFDEFSENIRKMEAGIPTWKVK